jgi:hypothetical protein
MGFGVKKVDEMDTPPGVVNGAAPERAAASGLAQRAIAASPAALPNSRASFHTVKVWVPSATRFKAACSAS